MSDWAGVLEVWTYYSLEANTHTGPRMHENMHFETQKLKKNAGEEQ